MRKFIQKILKNIFSILIFFKTDFQYFYKEYFESFKKNFEKINNFHNETWNKHIKNKVPFSEVYYIYNEFK